MTPVFLDANVFLYARGAPHPLRTPCRRLLEAASRGDIDTTTSVEVVQELLHVLTRRGFRAEALTLARSVLATHAPVLSVTPQVLVRACDLLERYPGLGARDALHAATALEHGAARIASADAGFDVVEEIERVAPENFAVLSPPG